MILLSQQLWLFGLYCPNSLPIEILMSSSLKAPLPQHPLPQPKHTSLGEKHKHAGRLSSPSKHTHVRTGTRRRFTQQSNRKRPGSWCAHWLPSGSGLRSDTFLTFVLLIPLPGPRRLTGYLSSRLRAQTTHYWPDCFCSVLPILKEGDGRHLVFCVCVHSFKVSLPWCVGSIWFETIDGYKQVGADFFVWPCGVEVKAELRVEELECGIH